MNPIKRRNKINGQFSVRLVEMQESPAYRALSRAAHLVISRIEIELAHHGGNDNGRLPVTHEQFIDYGVHHAWGAQAGTVGWTARELFGLHPVTERPAPTFRRLSRYDSTGLIWLLQGRPVIGLTENEAAIQSAGAVVTYRKQRKPALGPLGDSLDDMDPRSTRAEPVNRKVGGQ
jgi:hypothetical protein